MDETNITHEEKIAQQTKRLDSLVRRFETIFSFSVPVFAVLAGLAVAGLLILGVGVSPFQAYAAMLKGAFGNAYAIGTSLNKATPLILTGMGVIIAFRGGLFNVGGEGQICMGGFAAAVAGIYITGLPIYIHIPVAFLAAFLAGAIWSMIAGYLYSKYNVNLLITTIMMNYIATYIINIMVKGPIQEPPGYFVQSKQLLESAWLPILGQATRLHSGIYLALASAIIFHIVLWNMPFGYEIRAIGENIIAARHAGMKVMRDQLLIMFISGGLAGLAGAVEIMGAQYRLRPNFLMNFGYDAIAVALLGQLQPLATIISGILFGALRAGAGTMQRTINLPMSLVFVVQGIVIMFVVGSSILMRLPRYLAKKEAGRGN